MVGEHFQTLRAIFRPWYVKVGSGLATLFAAVGIYATLQDQFPDKLPKLQDLVTMSHVLILPWWGWLLVLQAILGFGLYDYVRRTIGNLKPGADDLACLAIARVDQHAPRLARLEESSKEMSSLQATIGTLRDTVADLVRRQVEHVSTPELGARFQKETADLNNRLVARIAALDTQVDERIKNAGFEKRGEIVKFMADAKFIIDGAQNSVTELRKTTNLLSAKSKAISLDLLHILDFEIDQATLRFLDGLIAQVPVLKTPIAKESVPEVRGTMYDTAANSIQFVSAHLGDTTRGQNFRSVMGFAVTEAERALKTLALSDWPSDVGPVDFRQYAIVELQCARAIAFLEYQKREVIEKIRAARSNLIGRKMEREAEIREPPP